MANDRILDQAVPAPNHVIVDNLIAAFSLNVRAEDKDRCVYFCLNAAEHDFVLMHKDDEKDLLEKLKLTSEMIGPRAVGRTMLALNEGIAVNVLTMDPADKYNLTLNSVVMNNEKVFEYWDKCKDAGNLVSNAFWQGVLRQIVDQLPEIVPLVKFKAVCHTLIDLDPSMPPFMSKGGMA